MPTDPKTGKSNSAVLKLCVDSINSDLETFILDSRKCDPADGQISKIMYLKDFEQAF